MTPRLGELKCQEVLCVRDSRHAESQSPKAGRVLGSPVPLEMALLWERQDLAAAQGQ